MHRTELAPFAQTSDMHGNIGIFEFVPRRWSEDALWRSECISGQICILRQSACCWEVERLISFASRILRRYCAENVHRVARKRAFSMGKRVHN